MGDGLRVQQCMDKWLTLSCPPWTLTAIAIRTQQNNARRGLRTWPHTRESSNLGDDYVNTVIIIPNTDSNYQ